MRVAVTGASGQLGTCLLRKLIADRKIKEIISIDVKEPRVPSGKLRHVTCDVRDEKIGAHFEGCDALFHFAFLVTVKAPRDLFWGVNVEGSKNVFRAAVAAKIPSIVYASSVAAYGVVPGHPVPILETTPRKHQPDFPYSATKFEVEQFLDALEVEHPSIAFVRLRPTILVGERMEHAFGDALKRRTLAASSNAPMPIVWDEDVADAAILAMKKKARGAFNLSADDLLSPADLARATGMRALKLNPRVALAFAKASPLLERVGIGQAMDEAWIESAGVTLVPSSEKAKRELEWKPKCPTAVDVVKRYTSLVPRRLDPRLRVFFRMVGVGAKYAKVPEEHRRTSLTIHVHLTGENGGDFGLIIREGKLSVIDKAPRSPSSIVTLPAALLVDAIAGKADLGSALMMTGKARVEGEPSAGMVLLGIVSMFKAGKTRAGAQGAAVRAMTWWMGRTAAV